MSLRRPSATGVAIGIAVAVVAVVFGAMAVLWAEVGNTEISLGGWIAMILGALVTLALGFGLMALVFISSRRGYDEAGTFRPLEPPDDRIDRI